MVTPQLGAKQRWTVRSGPIPDSAAKPLVHIFHLQAPSVCVVCRGASHLSAEYQLLSNGK